MKIITFPVGELGVNTYIISGNGTGCAVIDPGGDADRIRYALAENGLTAECVLLTHGHFDHIGAVAEFQRDGIPVYISSFDVDMLTDDVKNMAKPFNMTVEHPTADKLIGDGDVISVAGLDIKVISTPGHTPGGVCYLAEDNLFSGDTLFACSVGRCDHPGGNHTLLIRSVKEKLFCLSDNVKVYSGHGHATNIGTEKKYNPYCGGEYET